MVTYQEMGAKNAWNVAASDNGAMRFEVRDGDFPLGADGQPITVREQAYATFADTYSLANAVEVGFQLTVDEGLRNKSSYLIFSGLSINGPSGPSGGWLYSLNMVGEKLTAYVNYVDENGVGVSKKIYSDLSDLQRGATYDFDVKTVANADGTGRLVLTINGKMVADYSGRLGLVGQESVSLFEGIQRGATATETMTANFSPVTVTTGDSVSFPEVTTFLREPGLIQGEISYADDHSGDFFSDITGWAVPNTTVEIYVDGVYFDSVAARDVDGFFSYDNVRLHGLGNHSVSAIAVDSTGARSITSYPLVVPIGTPEDYAASRGGFFVVATGGRTYLPQGANKPWSVETIGDNIVRFELRDGERHEWDVGNWHTSERSELTASMHVFEDGVPIQISYGFMVEPGAPNTAQWMVLGQLHQDLATPGVGASPPFDIGMDGERMVVDIRYGSSFASQSTRLFVDTADLQRGHLYDIKIAVVFDAAGNGHLTVERDGVTIVDYKGPLGYAEQNGVYWAEGIYRAGNATETMAAQYHHVDIKTGADVTFAPEGSFITAPVLDVTSGVVSADGTTTTFHMTGTALANSTVSIFQGGQLLTTVLADSTGHFALDVTTPTSASQSFGAYATSEGGRQGLSSVPAVVLTTTAADLVSKLGTLANIAGLEAIVLTDSHTLQITAPLQLAYAFKRDAAALSTIIGDFKLVYVESFTGKTYDKQITTYAPDGHTTLVERFAGTRLTYRDEFAADGSHTLSTYDANGGETRNHYNAANQRYAYETFDAQGRMVNAWEVNAGAQTTHFYSVTTGLETRTLVVMPDKTKTDTLLNIQGRDYVTQISHFDATNKLVAQERVAASGITLVAQTWNADGSTTQHVYSSQTGLETSSTQTFANGARTVTTFGIAGKAYVTEALRYDASNRPSGVERFDSAGIRVASETWNADGSRQVFALDAAGLATGYTLTAGDLSFVTVRFATPGSTDIVQSSSFAADGHLLETKTFAADHSVQTVDTYAADGSHSLKSYVEAGVVRETRYDAAQHVTDKITYDLAGKVLDATQFLADGARIVTTFDATNHLTVVERFDASGVRVSSEIQNADGSKQVFALDASGLATGYTLTAADQSYVTVVFAAPGSTDVAQSSSFAADGHLLERKVFGPDHSLQTVDTFASDGSHNLVSYMEGGIVRETRYDAAEHMTAKLTYNLSGVLLNAQNFLADGTRVIHAYDGTTGLELASRAFHPDGSRTETAYQLKTPGYTAQAVTYNAAGQPVETQRWLGDKLVLSTTKNADGSETILAWDAQGRETIKHTTGDGTTQTQNFDADGHLVTTVVVHLDGSRETHRFDTVSGNETGYTAIKADGSKEIATLGITGKAYATQHSFYDKAGHLTDVVRHFDGPTGQVAQSTHYGSDGSVDVKGYSPTGQLTSHSATEVDGSRLSTTLTYADPSSTVASQIREEHWNAAGQRTFIDVTSATGSHSITGYTKGLTVASHDGVSDIFALAGGDHFVFAPNAGNDKIIGFHADAGALHDTIEISSQIATQFSDLHISQVGADVVIALSDHDSITLTKTSLASITPDDFHFF